MQLKNRRGSALMITMGVVAIIVVLFPIVMKYLGTFDITTANLRKQDDFERFITSIRLEMNDGISCVNLLGSGMQTLNPAALNTPQKINISTSYAGVPGPITDDWASPTIGVAVDKVTIILKSHALDQSGNPKKVVLDWPPKLAPLDKYEAEILITPKNLAWSTDATRFPNRRIPIFVNLLQTSATSGTIMQCYGPGSIAEACEAIGGAFDGRSAGGLYSPSQSGLRCNPDVRCFNSNAGMTDNPSACTYPYVTNYVGNFNGTKKYLCTWCNRNK